MIVAACAYCRQDVPAHLVRGVAFLQHHARGVAGASRCCPGANKRAAAAGSATMRDLVARLTTGA